MVRYQNFKDGLLAPLLNVLARCRVTPDHVTIVSTLAGLAFCPLYFWSPAWAYGLLFAHLLLDGIDGPLARHCGLASARGSFTDTVGDQIVVVATSLTWMYASTVEGLVGIDVITGGVHLLLYTVVVAFAMVRNALGIPYAWLLRPRNFVYAWFFLESFFFAETFLEGSVFYAVWFFNLLLGAKFVTGFFHIRAKL